MRPATSAPRMNADERGLKHRDLTEKLIRVFYSIYNELGHGFLESVYEQAFAIPLAENGIFFERQIAVPVRATEIEVGLLFNFGPKAVFKRYIFDNDKKNPRKSVSIRGEEVS